MTFEKKTGAEATPAKREAPQEHGLPLELTRRIFYTLLEPPTRLAYTLKIPLKELAEWAQLAYYHETKRNGLKVHDAADLLKVTPRTVSNLAKKLKLNFLKATPKQDLVRQIEFVLWAGALSEIRLCNALPDEDAEIKAALRQLVEEGRVVEERGRTTTYRIARHQVRLPRDTWLARIDGLSNLLNSVTNAVYGRFFHQDPQTFARTISLRVRPEDLERFKALYEEVLWEELVAIDAAAADDPEAVNIDLSYIWAPSGYIKRWWDQDEG